MRLRDAHGPVAASTFAGFLGAGLLDAAVTLARGGAPGAAGGVLALAVGLYGAAGLVAAVVAGLAAGGVTAAVASGGGGVALRADADRDRAIATGILTVVVGVVVAAVVAAAGQRMFVGKMASARLAAIAAGGMVVLAAPVAAVVALLALPALRAVARRIPRPGPLGATGLLLLALVAGAILAGVVALSRADWRVLDLGPLWALGAAVILGAAHGIFWYGDPHRVPVPPHDGLGRAKPVRPHAIWYGLSAGRRLHARVPATALKVALPVVIIAALALGARVPEGAPAYAAISDGSLGLRLGVGMARRLSDGDGDGFSVRFGGGDCDDRRADVYPGAEDVPGDGVDQNCEGGDAKAQAAQAEEPAAPPTARRQGPAFTGNILIVTIDAFRADRLGVAGYGRPPGRSLTPTLDALARRGAYFRRVWAQAPNTPRSFPSILTGRYPSDIAFDKPGVNYPNLLPSNKTMFQGLAATGLKPIGIFSHFYFTSERGISAGFAEWSDDGAGTIAESNKDIASPRIVPRVIARLKQAAASKERFVLWTHLFEPHSSYMPHKEFPLSLSGVPGLMEKYDYEIAFTDIWLGKLLAAVQELGLADSTAIVVMADHGEAWGEHRVYFHGQDLFDEQLRVPLVLMVPGGKPGVFDDDVALVDVAPTVLDLVGAPVPAGMRGRSLLPRIESGTPVSHPIFAELLPATAWPHHAVMMIDGGHKIIHRISDRRWELYDLRRDPGEKKNLADDPGSRQTLEALRAKLLAFEERRR